jgi:tetratricopeptide (TPR) repeat protein
MSNPTSLAGDRTRFDDAVGLFTQKKIPEALSVLESITDPQMLVLKYYYIGLCYVQIGELEKALDAYRHVREVPATLDGIGSENILFGLYINMGSVLQALAKNKGRKYLEDAVECYKYAQQLDASNPKVWNNLGNAHLDLEQYGDAEAAFQKAIELDDEFPEANYSLSLVYEFTGRYEDAISQLKLVYRFKSRNKLVLNRLAGLNFGIGRYDEAKTYALRAVESHPQDPTAHKNLALVLYNLQDYSQAYQVYLKFKELAPTFNDPEVNGLFKDLEIRMKKM